MTQTVYTSRDVAVSALRDRGGNVSAHLDRLCDQGRLSPQDRALARELALGALRRQGTLAAVLRAFLNEPGKRLPGPLEEILHVAIYQLLFMDRIPQFAAVNEAVEQAQRMHHRRQSGFVNGVLRTVTKNLLPPASGRPPLAVDVVPVSADSYVKFARPVFPDPAQQPAAYVAAAHSLPLPLVERWIDRLGLDKTVDLAMHANTRAPMILRVNRLRSGVEQVLASLQGSQAPAIRHANGVSVVLPESANVMELAAFKEGLIQPQDATASAVAMAAAPQPGINVLDFCASPGTKTTFMAELMNNQGSILAMDVNQEKLDLIESNCRRLGVTIVRTQLSEAVGHLQPQSFDLVLADVPCSNTGVLARRAEARWRFDPQRLEALAKDQQFLAAAAAQFVRRGGRLVYSTCSIEPEECSQIAQRLVQRQPQLALVKEELILPGGAEDISRWHDGGYCAVFTAK